MLAFSIALLKNQTPFIVASRRPAMPAQKGFILSPLLCVLRVLTCHLFCFLDEAKHFSSEEELLTVLNFKMCTQQCF